MVTRESAALSGWYQSHPEIRRLWALGDNGVLRVIVQVERTIDSNEIHPAWWANRHTWIEELQSCTGRTVRLEAVHEDGALANTIADDPIHVVVAALFWRDAAFR